MRKLRLWSVVGVLLAGVVLGGLAGTAPAAAAPAAPRCIITDEITPHTVDVFWCATPGAVSYQVFFNGTRWIELDPAFPATLPMATLRHLPFNTVFVIEVRTVDAAGHVSSPAAVRGRTAYYSDRIPPTAPTNLNVSAEPFGAPVPGCVGYLRWTAGVDNARDTLGESEIYRDGVLAAVIRRGGADRGGLWHYIAPDRPGPHVYTVKTLDLGGNTSPPSAPLTVSFAGC